MSFGYRGSYRILTHLTLSSPVHNRKAKAPHSDQADNVPERSRSGVHTNVVEKAFHKIRLSQSKAWG